MDFSNLQKLRQERDLMQTNVARHLNISPASYSQYENGRRTPPLEVLYKLCQLYDVDMETLLGWQKQRPGEASAKNSDPGASTEASSHCASAPDGVMQKDSLPEPAAVPKACTDIDYIIFKHNNGEPLTGHEIELLISHSRQNAAASSRLRQLEYFERLRSLYVRLNESGQREAVKRIEELTELSRYTRPENTSHD